MKHYIALGIIGIILVILTTIPVFIGYANETGRVVFFRYWGRWSRILNTYFDYMNQAANGKIMFVNSYAGVSYTPLLIRPLFTEMGWVLNSFCPPLVVFHLYRILIAFFSHLQFGG